MVETPGQTTAARSASGVASEIRTPAPGVLHTGRPFRGFALGVIARLTRRGPLCIVVARRSKATVQGRHLLRFNAQRALEASQAAQVSGALGVVRIGAQAARAS